MTFVQNVVILGLGTWADVTFTFGEQNSRVSVVVVGSVTYFSLLASNAPCEALNRLTNAGGW